MSEQYKKGKVGKRRLPYISNQVYSFLLYQIAYGNNYAQKIYEKNIKKYGKKSKVSVITRQLKVLQKDGVIEFKITKNETNNSRKKEYFIKWEYIIKEFHNFKNYIDNIILELENSDDEDYDSEPYLGGNSLFDRFEELLFPINKIFKNKKFKNSDKRRRYAREEKNAEKNQNRFLKPFIENIFKFLGKKSSNVSLYEIFELIPYLFIDRCFNASSKEGQMILKKIKKDEKFRDFFRFMFIIYHSYPNYSKYESIENAVENLIEEVTKK